MLLGLPILVLGTVGQLAGQANNDVRDEYAKLGPYTGPVANGLAAKSLTGKVMCGYQGWFGAPGDGSLRNGWQHWTKGRGPLGDGNAKVDLWPDVSDLPPAERFPTDFKRADGRPAEVFSSFAKATVLRHFQWMQDYGIDGVFVQRFANGLRNQATLEHDNTVLASCREGANRHGRTYAVMYDLSGLGAGRMEEVMNDWRALHKVMQITRDPAYQCEHGQPVVAVWGVGFNDRREYTLDECRRLVGFFKDDPEAGGCTVMLGVPAHWRELCHDAISDPRLLEVISRADIVSPWTVGRYASREEARRYARELLQPDLSWCAARHLECLPVVFPGFSWHNMKGGPLNQIPRQRGEFFWTQFNEVKRSGTSMVYVAMFDEVDEATAIFKCANNVPVGEQSQFLTYEGLPNDYYLRLAGQGGKLLRGQVPLDIQASQAVGQLANARRKNQ